MGQHCLADWGQDIAHELLTPFRALNGGQPSSNQRSTNMRRQLVRDVRLSARGMSSMTCSSLYTRYSQRPRSGFNSRSSGPNRELLLLAESSRGVQAPGFWHRCRLSSSATTR
jgi:hypothetical protein